MSHEFEVCGDFQIRDGASPVPVLIVSERAQQKEGVAASTKLCVEDAAFYGI